MNVLMKEFLFGFLIDRGILAAAKRQSIRNHFIWIASDGWGRQHKLVEGLEDVAEGALTVDLESNAVPGFDDYILSLTPYNNQRNLWYEDFWQEIFGCVLPHNTEQQSTLIGPTMCSPNLKLTKQIGYEQDSKIQFVVDAVYAFAHAMHALHQDVCRGRPGTCPAMLAYDGGDFYVNYILNVSFIGESNCLAHCTSTYNYWHSVVHKYLILTQSDQSRFDVSI